MFNTQVFNGISSMVVASATPFSITYNGQYLNDGVTYFGSVKYLNNKAIKYDSDFTDLNDGVIYNVREGEKGIQISGMIKSTDRGSLLAIIDTFKSSLLESNKMLVITE